MSKSTIPEMQIQRAPTMPFGKGKLVSELPRDYCAWLLGNFQGLRKPLEDALRARLAVAPPNIATGTKGAA